MQPNVLLQCCAAELDSRPSGGYSLVMHKVNVFTAESLKIAESPVWKFSGYSSSGTVAFSMLYVMQTCVDKQAK